MNEIQSSNPDMLRRFIYYAEFYLDIEGNNVKPASVLSYSHSAWICPAIMKESIYHKHLCIIRMVVDGSYLHDVRLV